MKKLFVLFTLLLSFCLIPTEKVQAGFSLTQKLELKNREVIIWDRFLIGELEPLLRGRTQTRSLLRSVMQLSWVSSDYRIGLVIPWSVNLTNAMTNRGWEGFGLQSSFDWSIPASLSLEVHQGVDFILTRPQSDYFLADNRVHESFRCFLEAKLIRAWKYLSMDLIIGGYFDSKSPAESERDPLNRYTIPIEWKISTLVQRYFNQGILDWKIFIGIGGGYRAPIRNGQNEVANSEIRQLFFPVGVTLETEFFDITFQDRLVADLTESKNYFWDNFSFTVTLNLGGGN